MIRDIGSRGALLRPYEQLGGNALPDAWLAAATLHLGEHLVSFDRGFKRLIGRAQFTLLQPANA